jgi:hypothetical protein
MDIGCDSLGMLQYIVIPIANHSISIPFQHRRSLRIIARLLRMLATIDLDRQLRLGAQKIDDVAVNRHLPSEAEAFDLSGAQTSP